MKNPLNLIFACFVLPSLAVAQTDQDLAAARMIEQVYRTSSTTEQTEKESFKYVSSIPTNASETNLDACLSSVAKNLKASVTDVPGGQYINGKDPGRVNAIWLRGKMEGCPNAGEMVVTTQWTSVKNGLDKNILSAEQTKLDHVNSTPVQFGKFVYYAPIDFKEGDSRPAKINGVIKIKVPLKMQIVELTNETIGKEFTVGTTRVKLLELKGQTYKLEMSGQDVKVLPISKTQQEFSMSSGTNIPLKFYEEFAKKESLSDDELKSILKTFDKNDKRVVKLGKVSGSIDKILVYIPGESVTKEIPIDLVIQ